MTRAWREFLRVFQISIWEWTCKKTVTLIFINFFFAFEAIFYGFACFAKFRSSINIICTIICQRSDHLRLTQFLMMEKQINLTIVATFIYLSDFNGCYWMILWGVQNCFRSFNTWAGVGMSGTLVTMSTV